MPLRAEHQAVLEANPWFFQLTAPLRDAILETFSLRSLDDGQYLFRRGEAPDSWYCVLSGAVRMSGTAASGKEFTLIYMKPGGWFGEISLFDKEPRSHDARAHGKTDILTITGDRFYTLVDRFPSLAHAVICLMSHRMRYMFGLIEDLGTLPLPQRVAKQLLSLVGVYGVPDGSSMNINLRLAQEEFAQMIGASRQRVNMELKQLEKLKLISQKNGFLVVLDPTALKRFAVE